MDFLISKQELIKGIARAYSVADRKASMPILANVLMTSRSKTEVEFDATDLYVGVSAKVNAEVSDKGSIALAAKTLFSIIKSLPEQQIKFHTTDKGIVEISCGRINYKLPTQQAEDFPPLPGLGNARTQPIPSKVLSELLNRTYYAMSTDETRPHLSSTLLEYDSEKIRVVCTDGHRLSKAEARGERIGEHQAMLIPAKGISELKRLLEEEGSERESTIEVGLAGGHVFFIRNNVQLSVKLTDEQFLPYEKVIPKSFTRRAVIDRHALLEALRRVNLVSSQRAGGIKLGFEKELLTIQTESAELGEAKEQLDTRLEGEPLTIGFNASYLIDVLSALDEEQIAIELSGEFDPGLIRPVESDAFIGVVMPMRI